MSEKNKKRKMVTRSMGLAEAEMGSTFGEACSTFGQGDSENLVGAESDTEAVPPPSVVNDASKRQKVQHDTPTEEEVHAAMAMHLVEVEKSMKSTALLLMKTVDAISTLVATIDEKGVVKRACKLYPHEREWCMIDVSVDRLAVVKLDAHITALRNEADVATTRFFRPMQMRCDDVVAREGGDGGGGDVRSGSSARRALFIDKPVAEVAEAQAEDVMAAFADRMSTSCHWKFVLQANHLFHEALPTDRTESEAMKIGALSHVDVAKLRGVRDASRYYSEDRKYTLKREEHESEMLYEVRERIFATLVDGKADESGFKNEIICSAYHAMYDTCLYLRRLHSGMKMLAFREWRERGCDVRLAVHVEDLANALLVCIQRAYPVKALPHVMEDATESAHVAIVLPTMRDSVRGNLDTLLKKDTEHVFVEATCDDLCAWAEIQYAVGDYYTGALFEYECERRDKRDPDRIVSIAYRDVQLRGSPENAAAVRLPHRSDLTDYAHVNSVFTLLADRLRLNAARRATVQDFLHSRVDFACTVTMCRQVLTILSRMPTRVHKPGMCGGGDHHHCVEAPLPTAFTVSLSNFMVDEVDRVIMVPTCAELRHAQERGLSTTFVVEGGTLDNGDVVFNPQCYAEAMGVFLYTALFDCEVPALRSKALATVPTHTRFNNVVTPALLDLLRALLVERRRLDELMHHRFFAEPNAHGRCEAPLRSSQVELTDNQVDVWVNSEASVYQMARLKAPFNAKTRHFDAYLSPAEAFTQFHIMRRMIHMTSGHGKQVRHGVRVLEFETCPRFDVLTPGVDLTDETEMERYAAEVFNRAPNDSGVLRVDIIGALHDSYWLDVGVNSNTGIEESNRRRRLAARDPSLSEANRAELRLMAERGRTYLPAEIDQTARSVQCHTCSGMRMVSKSMRAASVRCMQELVAKEAEEARAAAARTTTEREARVAKAVALAEFMTTSVIHTLQVSVQTTRGLTRMQSARRFVSEMVATLSMRANMTEEATRYALWCAVEVAISSDLTEQRNRHSQFNTLRNVVLHFSDIFERMEEVPGYIKSCFRFYQEFLLQPNVMGTQAQAQAQAAAATIAANNNAPVVSPRRMERIRRTAEQVVDESDDDSEEGGDSENLVRDRVMPLCAKHRPGHVRYRGRLPFAFLSISRSTRFVQALNTDLFGNILMLFCDSTQRGRGPGPSTAIVNDFFAAVFEDHALFARSDEVDDDGRYTYSLAEPSHGADGAPRSHTCDACTHLVALMVHGDDYAQRSPPIRYGCELFATQFFTLLGRMLRFALLQHIEVPYKLHPQLLHMLLNVTLLDHVNDTTGHAHIDLETLMALHKPDVVRQVQAASDTALRAMDIEYDIDGGEAGGKNLDTTLCAPNKVDYLRRYLDTMSVDSMVMWVRACMSFHLPPFTMLVKHVCGNSVECLERLICGAPRALTAALIQECTTVTFTNYAYSAGTAPRREELRDVREFVKHAPYVYGENQCWSVDARTYCAAKLEEIFQYLPESSRTMLQQCIRGDSNHQPEHLDDDSETAVEEEWSCAASAAQYLHKYLEDGRLLAEVMQQVALDEALAEGGVAIEKLQQFLRTIYTHLCANTVNYFHRWLNKASEEKLRSFVNMCTGRSSVPQTYGTDYDRSSEEHQRERRKLFERMGHVLNRDAFSKYDGLRIAALEHAEATIYHAHAATPGSKQNESFIRVYVADTAIVSAPYNYTKHRSMATVFRNLLRKAEEKHGQRFAKGEPSLTMIMNWKEAVNRLPMFSTCARYCNLYVYTSYAAFEKAMDTAVYDGATFEME